MSNPHGWLSTNGDDQGMEDDERQNIKVSPTERRISCGRWGMPRMFVWPTPNELQLIENELCHVWISLHHGK